MSSDENYSEDDFEDDFEDLTETGTPANADELEETAEDMLEDSNQLNDATTKNENVVHVCADGGGEITSTVVQQPTDPLQLNTVTKSPMSRQKRWSDVCNASNNDKNDINNASIPKISIPPPLPKNNDNTSLAIKEHRKKIESENKKKRNKLKSTYEKNVKNKVDHVVKLQITPRTASENYRMPYANNLKKNQKKKVNSIIKNQVHNQKKNKHSNINDTSTQSPSIEREKQRHLKKISKVAEKKRKEKRKKQRKKLIDRIKNRNRLNHPSSYGRGNNKSRNGSVSLKAFLAMKASPSLPTFNLPKHQVKKNNIATYASAVPSPIRAKTMPSPSIMTAIPNAVWQIHAKLNKKELHLKAKERALQACEDALVAREKAITIRENAIEQKILNLGLHEYDPENIDSNAQSSKNSYNFGNKQKVKGNLLPSFASNTRCPRSLGIDDNESTDVKNECISSDDDTDTTNAHINEKNDYIETEPCENNTKNMEPESMSSQLLNLFKGATKAKKDNGRNDCQEWCDTVGKTAYFKKNDNNLGYLSNNNDPTTPSTPYDNNVVIGDDDDSLERIQTNDGGTDRINNSENIIPPNGFLPSLNKKKHTIEKRKKLKKLCRSKKITNRNGLKGSATNISPKYYHNRSNNRKIYSGLYSVARPSISKFL